MDDGRDVSHDTPSVYDETVSSSSEILGSRRVLLHAERLNVEKVSVRARVARISRRTVTEPRTFTVDVLREELVIEYVDGDMTPMLDEGFQTIIVQLHAEEIEVSKTVRVVEEIAISKKRVRRIESVSDAIRRESLDVLSNRE